MDIQLYNCARKGDMVSIVTNQSDVAEYLTRTTPKTENSVLHIAVEYQRELFFLEALDRVADPEELLQKRNSLGETALHAAVKSGSLDMVMLVVQIAKDRLHYHPEGGVLASTGFIKTMDRNGNNAMHLAAIYGSAGIAKELASGPPDLGLSVVVNLAGESPCFLAVSRGNMDIARILLKQDQPKNANLSTPMHAAVHSSQEMFELVLRERQEMIGQADMVQRVPLHYAAAEGKVEIVRSILAVDLRAANSCAYAQDDFGATPLHMAAYKGSVDVLKVIMERYPDCWTVVDKKGRTAFHSAVLGGNKISVKFFKKLLPTNKLFLAVDNDGNSPLHLAVLSKNAGITYILSKDCPNWVLKSTNNDHMTALDIFEKNPFWIISRFPWMAKYNRGLKARQQLSTNEFNTHISRDFDQLEPEEGSEPHEDNSVRLSATLIATVTFAAVYTPLGGYRASGGKYEGMTVLAAKRSYDIFIFFNILTFFLAMTIVIIKLAVQLRRNFISRGVKKRIHFASTILLALAFKSMIIAFVFGTSLALPNKSPLTNVIYWEIFVLVVVIMFVIAFLFDTPSPLSAVH